MKKISTLGFVALITANVSVAWAAADKPSPTRLLQNPIFRGSNQNQRRNEPESKCETCSILQEAQFDDRLQRGVDQMILRLTGSFLVGPLTHARRRGNAWRSARRESRSRPRWQTAASVALAVSF